MAAPGADLNELASLLTVSSGSFLLPSSINLPIIVLMWKVGSWRTLHPQKSFGGYKIFRGDLFWVHGCMVFFS